MGLITGRQSHLVHPSNRLYRGECVGFKDAVETYRAALRYERGVTVSFGDGDADDDLIRLLDRGIKACDEVLRDYANEVAVAEGRLIQRLCASDDEEVRRIGEAARDDDYSVLAI